MFKNVDEFLLRRPYVRISTLVVGRVNSFLNAEVDYFGPHSQ